MTRPWRCRFIFERRSHCDIPRTFVTTSEKLVCFSISLGVAWDDVFEVGLYLVPGASMLSCEVHRARACNVSVDLTVTFTSFVHHLFLHTHTHTSRLLFLYKRNNYELVSDLQWAGITSEELNVSYLYG